MIKSKACTGLWNAHCGNEWASVKLTVWQHHHILGWHDITSFWHAETLFVHVWSELFLCGCTCANTLCASTTLVESLCVCTVCACVTSVLWYPWSSQLPGGLSGFYSNHATLSVRPLWVSQSFVRTVGVLAAKCSVLMMVCMVRVAVLSEISIICLLILFWHPYMMIFLLLLALRYLIQEIANKGKYRFALQWCNSWSEKYWPRVWRACYLQIVAKLAP